MRLQARRERIAEIVKAHGQASVEDLAEKLAASRETIRRDLTALDEQGLLRKFHGGARRISGGVTPVPTEGGFALRMAENIPEKRRIAERAASLFSNGDTLFMDCGSTTIVFAEKLARLSGLTVITNSLKAAQFLGQRPGRNSIFLVGGQYEGDAQETLGQIAQQQLSYFRAQHVVLTVGALQVDGIFDFDLREAELARAMIAQARTVTVLADHSKMLRAAVFEVAPLSRINRLVTDREPPAQLSEALMEADVEVLAAIQLD